MLPSALMGLKIDNFKSSLNCFKNIKFSKNLIENVAYIKTLNSFGINNSVLLNYDSNLQYFSYWYEQLVAESLGKKQKGITPIISNLPKDNHSLLQLYLDGPKNKFFTFINSKPDIDYKIKNKVLSNNMKFIKGKNLSLIINAQYESTKKIFRKKNIPFRDLYIKNKTEKELGLLFAFFVFETILLARLMKVNPFDQPAVEQVKLMTKKFLLKN